MTFHYHILWQTFSSFHILFSLSPCCYWHKDFWYSFFKLLIIATSESVLWFLDPLNPWIFLFFHFCQFFRHGFDFLKTLFLGLFRMLPILSPVTLQPLFLLLSHFEPRAPSLDPDRSFRLLLNRFRSARRMSNLLFAVLRSFAVTGLSSILASPFMCRYVGLFEAH